MYDLDEIGISLLHVPALALFGYVSGTDPSGE
jgi:hypothetical protein